MPYLEGYLDTLSAAPGQTVRLHASTDVNSACSVRIVREGAPESVMLAPTPISVGDHPVPNHDDEPWRFGPCWPACWELKIPADWKSGVYRIELSCEGSFRYRADKKRRDLTGWSEQRHVHHLMLVVRASQPASTSKILLQLSTNTYAAYNMWGGKSTYPYSSTDNIQASHVTLLRPGHGYYSHSGLANWERPFLQWCEREGIAIEYAVNEDLAAWHDGFDDYRLVLSVGHDEYWSSPMRHRLESFVARGGNAAFFSGNSVCWQVRFEDNGQTMVTYKQKFEDDPVFKTGDHRLLTTLWSHPLVGRPENQLTGVGFPDGGYHRSHNALMDGSGAFTVRRPDHWVFEGTGLRAGDEFGGADTIVGYECDGCAFVEKDGLPFPTGKDGTPSTFAILAQAPAFWTDPFPPSFNVINISNAKRHGRATLGLYTTSAGGTVFTAGTTDWAHGLPRDEKVQRITRNVLGRLSRPR